MHSKQNNNKLMLNKTPLTVMNKLNHLTAIRKFENKHPHEYLSAEQHFAIAKWRFHEFLIEQNGERRCSFRVISELAQLSFGLG